MARERKKVVRRYLTVFRVPANNSVKALFLNVYGEPLKYENSDTASSSP